MHYIKIYIKDVIKNDFVYIETYDVNLLYQLRSKPWVHKSDFLHYFPILPNYHYTQYLRSLFFQYWLVRR